jgi:hypothetical protein
MENEYGPKYQTYLTIYCFDSQQNATEQLAKRNPEAVGRISPFSKGYEQAVWSTYRDIGIESPRQS